MKGLRFNRNLGELKLQISDDANWGLFDDLAHTLQRELNGSWQTKIDGIDQRYWDLAVDNMVLTLHLEHYLGITLSPKLEASEDACCSQPP